MKTEKESDTIGKGKLIMSTVLPREEAVETIFLKFWLRRKHPDD